MTSVLQEVKEKTQSMGREAYLRNSNSNPFELHSVRHCWWQEGWGEEKDEKTRSDSARNKVYSK